MSPRLAIALLLLLGLAALAPLSGKKAHKGAAASPPPPAAIAPAGVVGSWFWSDADARVLETLDYYPQGVCVTTIFDVINNECTWFRYRYNLKGDSILILDDLPEDSQPYALSPDSLFLSFPALDKVYQRSGFAADTIHCIKLYEPRR